MVFGRFVSASTGDDIASSLQQIWQGVLQGQITVMDVAEAYDVLTALLTVLQDSKYKGLTMEDGSAAVARIYLALLSDSSASVAQQLLQEPVSGQLLETAIDVASDGHLAAYPHVLALQLLQKLCHSHPKLAQQQLLVAPNGLHRIGDLLQTGTD